MFGAMLPVALTPDAAEPVAEEPPAVDVEEFPDRPAPAFGVGRDTPEIVELAGIDDADTAFDAVIDLRTKRVTMNSVARSM